MDTKRQSPYIGCSDGTSFTICKGDRDYPFSESKEEKIGYEFTNNWKDADVILHLIWGWAFIARVKSGNIEKDVLQIDFKELKLDEGFYLLKETCNNAKRSD